MSFGIKEHSKVLQEAPYRKGDEAEKGLLGGGVVLGRLEFSCHPPSSSCLQAYNVQSPNRGSLLPHYVNPACHPHRGAVSLPHYHKEQSSAHHHWHTMLDFCCIIWKEKGRYSVIWRESDDCHTCNWAEFWNHKLTSTSVTWPQGDAEPPGLCTAIIVSPHSRTVALFPPHNTAQKSKVKRTQVWFCTHLRVSSSPIHTALISAVVGEGCT